MSQVNFIDRLRRLKPTLPRGKPQKKCSHPHRLYSPTIPVRNFSNDMHFMLEPVAGFPVDIRSPYCLDAIEQNLATYAQTNPTATDAVLMICRPNSPPLNFGEFFTPADAPRESE
jgi:hypothetical protein